MNALRICGLLFAAAACASAPYEPGADAQHPELMPRLRVTMLRPITEVHSFGGTAGLWTYSDKPTFVPPPHESQQAAIDAVIAWIVAHFGPLQPDTALVTQDVETGWASSSTRFNQSGGSRMGAELTVKLQQWYRGTPTSVTSLVHVDGRSRFSGFFQVATFEPVPGSVAPVMSAAAAVEAVVKFARANDASDADIATVQGVVPQLEYCCGPDDNDSWVGEDYLCIFSPHWRSPEWRWPQWGNRRLVVNAHTGQVGPGPW